ncbi:eukaryotic translation initiation factor 2c [Holotrichia oblita]|uniref:Eukaryotic translation initiation factor 2c n=1 Tax=Holotrichia oblita TaxID=644536 RepID=A0ACB9T9V9_HOLOL|nr:eukaryotic translation initiation factor 2c [Holotrichia oblita]
MNLSLCYRDMADRPPPKGRAALLEAFKSRLTKPGDDKQSSQQEEAPKPRGRAALISRMKELKIGSSVGPSSECMPSALPSRVEQPVKVEQPTPRESESKPELPVCSFKGTSGSTIHVTANYIRLSIEKNKGVFEYDIRFTPDIDAKALRYKILNSQMEQMGGVRIFDGGSVLYLPIQLPEVKTVFKCKHPLQETDVEMSITFKKAKRLGECVHLFNVLFKRVMHTLEYSRVGKNYFDGSNATLVPQHRLEVLPGYAIAVDEYEGGLMLCLDAQHRVLRTDTALQLMNDIIRRTPERFKDEASKQLIGSIVLTKYNNKTYIIDDILWENSPLDTFKTHTGNDISYIEYYKNNYGLRIDDHKQPLLLHLQKVHKSKSADMEERHICLIPELCNLTGLTDAMRSDFRVMKDVAQFTRITPAQRLHALKKYVANVESCDKARKILLDWGMHIENATIDLNARILTPEIIIFGNGVRHQTDSKTDWTGQLSRNSVLGPVDLYAWTIVYAEKDSRVAHEFAENMTRLGKSLGMEIKKPRMHALSNDKTNSYVNACSTIISDSLQIVVFIFPTIRQDLYSAVKKIVCVHSPIPSQCIISKTLNNQKRIRAVTLKIALQIVCKLGGALWTLQIPCKSWMVIGIDVYHSATGGKQSVCAFVANLNDTYSRWISMVTLQDREISNYLKICFVKALEKYREKYGSFPDKVIVFRDGVGEGQLSHCKDLEVPQFEETLRQFELDTKLCFVVVQKRINTRIFAHGQQGPVNPVPGTIVDDTITRRHLFDFYLIPQSVGQGTVTPTHYIVVTNTAGIKPDHLQKLAYKLCHLYYNWSGTIRVPAPCQYAHKLAYLVGQHIGKVPSETLNTYLFYL